MYYVKSSYFHQLSEPRTQELEGEILGMCLVILPFTVDAWWSLGRHLPALVGLSFCVLFVV